MAKAQVESITVGFGGLTLPVRGANRRPRTDFGRTREIEQSDVNRVMKSALNVALPEDCMVLHVLPQDFVVDDHPGHRDPRKMLGSVLEANVT